MKFGVRRRMDSGLLSKAVLLSLILQDWFRLLRIWCKTHRSRNINLLLSREELVLNRCLRVEKFISDYSLNDNAQPGFVQGGKFKFRATISISPSSSNSNLSLLFGSVRRNSSPTLSLVPVLSIFSRITQDLDKLSLLGHYAKHFLRLQGVFACRWLSNLNISYSGDWMLMGDFSFYRSVSERGKPGATFLT